MKTQEQLSALISVIYDAALDPADRSDVLEKIAAFTGGDSSGLILKHSLAASDRTARACRPIQKTILNSNPWGRRRLAAPNRS
jgi:hypothetical protein